MAHTYGNASTLATSTANPITSATYTPTSGATCVVLMLIVAGGTNRAGGSPTFNGVAMTQANSTQKGAASPEASVEVWYIAGASTPTSGTFSIPNSGGLSISYVAASGKAGAGLTSAFDAAIGSNGTSTNPTTTNLTTTVANDIIFAAVANGAQTWAPSARAGTQIFDNDLGAFGGGGQYLIKAVAGVQAMTWTFGTSEDWGAVAVAFKEVTAPLTLSGSSAVSTWDVGAGAVSTQVGTSGASAVSTWTVAAGALTIPASLQVDLYQGATLIATRTLAPTTLAQSDLDLTAPERASISDWTDLSVRYTKTGAQVDVLQTSLEAPVADSSSVTLSGSAASASWSVASGSLSLQVGLSGASAAGTWQTAAGAVSTSVAVSGAAAASSWTVSAGSIGLVLPLSGASAAGSWSVAAGTVSTSVAVSGSSAVGTWSVAAGAISVSGTATLSGAAAVSSWTVAAGAISASVSLSGAAAASTWSTAAGAVGLVQPLSGASAAGTWSVASGAISTRLALSGAAAASTWSVAAGSISAAGSVGLSGEAAVASWSVAAGSISTRVALSGASAEATWSTAAGALELTLPVTVTGSSASSSWSVAAGAVSTTFALSGASAASSWSVAAGALATVVEVGGVAPVASWSVAAGAMTYEGLTTYEVIRIGTIRGSRTGPSTVRSGSGGIGGFRSRSSGISGVRSTTDLPFGASPVPPSEVALSGAGAASSWGIAAGSLSMPAAPLTLVGDAAFTAWDVAGGGISVPGMPALSGAAASSTWAVAAGAISTSLTLSGGSAGATWATAGGSVSVDGEDPVFGGGGSTQLVASDLTLAGMNEAPDSNYSNIQLAYRYVEGQRRILLTTFTNHVVEYTMSPLKNGGAHWVYGNVPSLVEVRRWYGPSWNTRQRMLDDGYPSASDIFSGNGAWVASTFWDERSGLLWYTWQPKYPGGAVQFALYGAVRLTDDESTLGPGGGTVSDANVYGPYYFKDGSYNDFKGAGAGIIPIPTDQRSAMGGKYLINGHHCANIGSGGARGMGLYVVPDVPTTPPAEGANLFPTAEHIYDTSPDSGIDPYGMKIPNVSYQMIGHAAQGGSFKFSAAGGAPSSMYENQSVGTAVNDAIYNYDYGAMDGIVVLMNTPASGGTWVPEYYNGSSWVQPSGWAMAAGTASLSATENCFYWPQGPVPSVVDIGGGLDPQQWVRVRRTSAGTSGGAILSMYPYSNLTPAANTTGDRPATVGGVNPVSSFQYDASHYAYSYENFFWGSCWVQNETVNGLISFGPICTGGQHYGASPVWAKQPAGLPGSAIVPSGVEDPPVKKYYAFGDVNLGNGGKSEGPMHPFAWTWNNTHLHEVAAGTRARNTNGLNPAVYTDMLAQWPEIIIADRIDSTNSPYYDFPTFSPYGSGNSVVYDPAADQVIVVLSNGDVFSWKTIILVFNVRNA